MRKLALFSGFALSLLFLAGPLLLSLLPEFYINNQFSGSILNFPWEGFPLSLFAVLLFMLSALLSVSLLYLCLRSRARGIARLSLCLGHLAITLALIAFAVNSLKSDDTGYHMISGEGERIGGTKFRLVKIEPIRATDSLVKNVRVTLNVEDSLNFQVEYGRPFTFRGRRYFLGDFGYITSGVRLRVGGEPILIHMGEVFRSDGVEVGPGLNWYVSQSHRIKIQTDLMYFNNSGNMPVQSDMLDQPATNVADPTGNGFLAFDSPYAGLHSGERGIMWRVQLQLAAQLHRRGSEAREQLRRHRGQIQLLQLHKDFARTLCDTVGLGGRDSVLADQFLATSSTGLRKLSQRNGAEALEGSDGLCQSPSYPLPE